MYYLCFPHLQKKQKRNPKNKLTMMLRSCFLILKYNLYVTHCVSVCALVCVWWIQLLRFTFIIFSYFAVLKRADVWMFSLHLTFKILCNTFSHSNVLLWDIFKVFCYMIILRNVSFYLHIHIQQQESQLIYSIHTISTLLKG